MNVTFGKPGPVVPFVLHCKERVKFGAIYWNDRGMTQAQLINPPAELPHPDRIALLQDIFSIYRKQHDAKVQAN